MILRLGFLCLLQSSLSFAQPTPSITSSPVPEASGTSSRLAWVDSPTGRGTFQLVLTCFLTILIPTWRALHMNLPADDDMWVMVYLRKFKWIVVGMVAPEYVAGVAAGQSSNARLLAKEMRALYGEEEEPTFTLTHAHIALAGGYTLVDKTSQRLRLTGPLLYELSERGAIPLPTTPLQEIFDKSSTSVLMTLIAFIQISLLLANIIARYVYGLQVSLFELLALGTSLCAVATYCFWWGKPRNVITPFEIHSKVDMQDLHMIASAADLGRHPAFNDPGRGEQSDSRAGHRPKDPGERISLYGESFNGENVGLGALCLLAFTILIFTVPMVLAWDYDFPSQTEQIVWRISSVAAPALGLSLLLVVFVGEKFDAETGELRWKPWGLRSWEPLRSMVLTLYILCRTYLVFEVLYAMRSVPAEVYDTVNWPGWLGHL